MKDYDYELIETFKGVAETYLEIAERYHEDGDDEKAVRFYENAVRSLKDVIEVYMKRTFKLLNSLYEKEE